MKALEQINIEISTIEMSQKKQNFEIERRLVEIMYEGGNQRLLFWWHAGIFLFFYLRMWLTATAAAAAQQQ